MAASALAAGMRDYANGGLTVATKLRSGETIAQLYELRRLMAGAWDFDGICHQYGRLALAEACPPANEAERRILDTLVNSVMEILRKLVLSELH